MKTVNITTYKAFLDEIKTEALAQGWTLVNDVTKTDNFRDLVLRNVNGMYVSLSEGYFYQNTVNGVPNIIVPNFFESYNSSLPLSSNQGAFNNPYINTEYVSTGFRYMRLINNSMNLFLFINAYKILVVAKVDQSYSFLYLGEASRLGTFEQYKRPWLCSCNTQSSGNTVTYQNFLIASNTKVKDINNNVINLSYRYPDITDTNNFDYQNNNILVPILVANAEAYLLSVEDCYFITSTRNIISENVLVQDGIEYIIFRSSTSTTGLTAYIAIKK